MIPTSSARLRVAVFSQVVMCKRCAKYAEPVWIELRNPILCASFSRGIRTQVRVTIAGISASMRPIEAGGRKTDSMRSEEAMFAKCAWRLIPFVVVLFTVNFLDRVNVGFAALTMNRD